MQIAYRYAMQYIYFKKKKRNLEDNVAVLDVSMLLIVGNTESLASIVARCREISVSKGNYNPKGKNIYKK